MYPPVPAFVACLLALLLGACNSDRQFLQEVLDRGELRFITRNSPTTYYIGRSGPRGFEYDMAAQLAEELGVKLVLQQAFSIDDMFLALERGEADIAGAGLTLTSGRRGDFTETASYASQHPQVIYKVGERRPRRIEDLEGLEIIMLAGSSHEDLAKELQSSGRDWLSWTLVASADPGELLTRVNDDRADVAIIDSREFFIQQTLVPRLEVAFNLAEVRDIVWYLPGAARESKWLERVNRFLRSRREDGSLAALRQRYFDRDASISRVDSQTFVRNVKRKLRDYQQLIETVAREHQLPWELLAAISYQESHWDPQATSRTGVRGMMMLTRTTAEELGVTNRTDAAQSLRGGARYFKDLRRRLPADIAEPDRSWMALAAYNIGMGHLEDARVLAQRRGGDPHLWEDLMDSLPLLQEGKHHRTLRYGYARGLEALGYVQNIRHYYNILRWQTARAARPVPPVDPGEFLPSTLQGLSLRAL
ncbi:MAG: membrane-bound lytic murein transglycosylase F [Halieaceae bacterium]|jgi:membrane-bound lytic murein transglycosylase F